MIAIVTGGSGFIGTNLVRRLVRDGHEVRCLGRGAARTPPDGGGGSSFQVDFADYLSVARTPALEGADVVFHLAGATRAVTAGGFAAANVVPTRHILQALTDREERPRLVFVSSQASAGPARSLVQPVTESDVPRPVEAYGRSKLEAERVVAEYADRVPSTIVRPCSVFGPYDRDFLHLFRYASRGIVPYPGVAAHWISLLYVEDVVDGLLAAAASSSAVSRTYFLSSTRPVQWHELGAMAGDAVGRRVRHLNIPRAMVRVAGLVGERWGRLTKTVPLANTHKVALTRHPYWVCSGERARGELALAPLRSLPEALRETYYWYLRHDWLRHRGGNRSAVPVSGSELRDKHHLMSDANPGEGGGGGGGGRAAAGSSPAGER